MNEDVLRGGVNVVRHRGGAVHRPATEATPTLHRLLAHLAAAGFRGSPVPLGFDDDGDEVLTYVDGDVHESLPAALRTPELVTSAAVLLRELHDATTTFPRSDADRWALPERSPAEVVCHGDVAPYNSVVVGGRVVGLIDFDTAHPGPRLWDVAYAVYRYAPLHAPSNPDSAGDVVEQARWAALFCRAYGVPPAGELLDAVVERLETLIDFMYARADAGDAAFRQHIAEGHAALYGTDILYLREQRGAMLRAFAGPATPA